MMNELRYFGKDNGTDEDHLRKQPTATAVGVLPSLTAEFAPSVRCRIC